MEKKFDLEEALEEIKAGAKIDGKNGVLAPLIKQLTEAALEAEIAPQGYFRWAVPSISRVSKK